MKRIKSHVNPKDRVVCESVAGIHKFYFQSSESKEQLYLFEKDRSPSIYSFFKDYGVSLNGLGYSLTLKQIYEHRKMYRNHKIKEFFDRLPKMIDYVLYEHNQHAKQIYDNITVNKANDVFYEDFERAA